MQYVLYEQFFRFCGAFDLGLVITLLNMALFLMWLLIWHFWAKIWRFRNQNI